MRLEYVASAIRAMVSRLANGNMPVSPGMRLPQSLSVRPLSRTSFDDYRRFQSEHLSRINGVQNVKTEVPSETIKRSYELPLR
jgi:hypothetical protein